MALGEQVARQLRVAIITGQLTSGQHLAEEELAAQYQVSRGPVRDALKILVKEGLVEQQRTRLYARGFTLQDIDELYGIRELIEVAAAKAALQRAGTRDWESGFAIIDEMRAAADAGDEARFTAADTAFHQLFYTLSGNRRLAEVWHQFEGTFEVLFELSNTFDLGAAVDDHRHILELFASGDGDAALKEVHNHLQRARAHIRDVVRSAASDEALAVDDVG
ncbi:GntR family transcriptional regulator [Herbiconiux sp. L3-i23]|uniref:GntR family transcriptional regulator n=1 Tax=Herbiconiux sp. L3-i23 TaxID=2905871 RepID=UPI002072D835|nr:GntR family transcriptional regulator [Herbiconiux sp. L3-i23]